MINFLRKLLARWRPIKSAPTAATWTAVSESAYVNGEYLLQANGKDWLLYAANAQCPSVCVPLTGQWTNEEFERACDELVLRLQGHALSSQRAAMKISHSRAHPVVINCP